MQLFHYAFRICLSYIVLLLISFLIRDITLLNWTITYAETTSNLRQPVTKLKTYPKTRLLKGLFVSGLVACLITSGRYIDCLPSVVVAEPATLWATFKLLPGMTPYVTLLLTKPTSANEFEGGGGGFSWHALPRHIRYPSPVIVTELATVLLQDH